MEIKDLIEVLSTKPSLELKISCPPSVNQMYSNHTKGRVLTLKARNWKKKARCELYGQKLKYFTNNEKIVVVYQVPKLTKHKKDCANYEKAASDFLSTIGIISDDSQIESNNQMFHHQDFFGIMIFDISNLG